VSAWTAGWIGWVLWFAVEEGLALRKGTYATLSGHIWKWFGMNGADTPSPITRARRFTLVAGLAWLCAHLLSHGYF
jgi:hypothetical protein